MLGCTEKELCGQHHLASQKIRDQDYNEITDSHRIGQETLANEWRRTTENQGQAASSEARSRGCLRERNLGR